MLHNYTMVFVLVVSTYIYLYAILFLILIREYIVRADLHTTSAISLCLIAVTFNQFTSGLFFMSLAARRAQAFICG